MLNSGNNNLIYYHKCSVFIWINDFLSYLEWSIVTQIEEMLPHDITVNKMLSKFGAEHILGLFNDQPVDILTHCNTGSLATAGYGTALGKMATRLTSQLVHPQRLWRFLTAETLTWNFMKSLTVHLTNYSNIIIGNVHW